MTDLEKLQHEALRAARDGRDFHPASLAYEFLWEKVEVALAAFEEQQKREEREADKR